MAKILKVVLREEEPKGEGWPDDSVLWDDIDSPADDRWRQWMQDRYPELSAPSDAKDVS